ncbi:MAG TPA: hypothetical protein VEZ48_02605, partial [Sphingomonadaceae bacterium]|nr:hypothetical protein [Sphingomonadaceae bacterium]
VLLVIVAVAVTIATKGALTKFAAGALKGALGLGAAAVKATAALAPVIGGALAGAAGSIASQGFGVATGLQDRFSWTGVAMAGISGGVGGGLGGAAGGGFVGGAIGGIAGNAMTQGIALATGLQNKFDWAGLAVAGVVGGAIGAMNGHFGNTAAPRSLESYGQQLASGMAGAIAGGAARSLIDGSSFGDNVLAALPDVIGSTIGNMVGHGVSSRGETAMARLRREGGVEYAQNVDSNVRSDHDEIIVTASRSRLAAARRGFFGSIHESLSGVDRFFGRLFRGGSRNSIDTTALVRNISMSIRRAPSATAEFGSGLGHGLYNVGANAVTGLYHLVTTNPLTTIKATGYALAGGIDSILEAENTPARIQLGRAGSALSNASAFDLGYGVGNVGGNIALLVAPELLAGRAGAVGRVGVAEGPLISDVRAISAADVNAPFLAKGWDAPYSYGSQARTFTTSADLDFVRVTTTNPEGAFLVRGKEIAGMSPEQIQVHLALPKVPTNMLDVRVPIGTRMQTGFVGPQPAFGVTTRGGIQYQILDQIPSQSFGPMRPIR